MTLNFAQLRAFLAVVDEGGFGTAAESLGLTQSAVSHAVAALERTLGQPVLHRRGAVRPTAFGHDVLAHARTAVAASVALTDLAARRNGLAQGTVKLAAPPTVCQGLLPDLLARWRDEFPHVRIRVFEGEDDEVADWLGNGTVEIAVVVDPPPGAGALVGEDAFHVLMREDHPLAGQAAVDVADLVDDPFLLSCGGCERHVRVVCQGLPITPVHRVRELGTLLAMVRAGIGISLVPGLLAAMLTPGLVLVPLTRRVTRRLVVSGPPDREWHPAVTALVASVDAGR
ncbi:LysR family transcriptional regulator [Actinosynnema sp. NPDC047251]|uniref:Transcriptional regulator, LysR family n=1 Tax=Saccharothrix espanaensis (strain ATCC 51144 / DSM 44229 / JCM 9112 / NBRC 15066 / NRRL 15764) TaxID=1179773 RepID=K0JPJ1_SACES|nr:LysR family transcriptional regulator [Saccharothrix espanaensis]CCH28790.1 Transcriptional regulator, LysR family [Saccharothrix espanaensis DSM 44229]